MFDFDSNWKHEHWNIDVGEEFYKKCSEHPLLKTHWKAIAACYRFLSKVAKFNQAKIEKCELKENVEVFSQIPKDIVRNYFMHYETEDATYTDFLEALQMLGLLKVNDSYRASDELKEVAGYCKSFYATPTTLKLLDHSTTGWLRMLHNNKTVKSKIKKRARQRKRVSYDDYVKEYIHTVNSGLQCDAEKAEQIMDDWHDRKRVTQRSLMISIAEQKLHVLRNNDSDNRIWNEWTVMNKELKTAYKYKKLKRAAVVDIRACHPTYFSSYVLDSYIVRGNVEEFTLDTLKYEHGRWVNMWTDKDVDPRNEIAASVGRDKDWVKENLNSTLNGNNGYPSLLDWIATNFPIMFGIWRMLQQEEKNNLDHFDIKYRDCDGVYLSKDYNGKDRTGCSISKNYETKIMLSPKLYQFAESLGVKLGYEYDGVSVFSKETGEKLEKQVQAIAEKIQQLSRNATLIDPVVKVEMI